MWRTHIAMPTRVAIATSILGLVVTASAGPATAQVARDATGSTRAASTSAPATSASEQRLERRMERRRQRVGFSPGFSILYQDRQELRGDLAGMYDMGARRLRVDLSWALVERDRGRFDWSHSDRVFGEAKAAGLKVLPILGYQPRWAGTERIDVDGFSDFVAAAVDRYGDQVPAWEVWNEPNLERFWFGRPDPQAYGRMVAATSAVIRAHDPGARVVVGALAPAVDAPSGSQISPETFLREAAPQMSPGDFDVVSVHPYSYPAMPNEALQWNTFFRLPGVVALAREIGGDKVRVWVTEYGAPTGDSDRSVRPARQAKMMARALRTARRMRGVGPVYLYSFRDSADDPGDAEANFGMVKFGGRPKPVLGRLTSILNE